MPSPRKRRRARFKAWCDQCQWSFAVRTREMAERLQTMHNETNCPTKTAKIGRMKIIVPGRQGGSGGDK